MPGKELGARQQLSSPYCILRHSFSEAFAAWQIRRSRAGDISRSWADEKVRKRAPRARSPGTFKADCMIYQHGDAHGEFRGAGVNEASNDNLAAEEDCVGREGNTPREYPRLCGSFSSPRPVFYFHRGDPARFFRFSSELERSTAANYITTAMIMRRGRKVKKGTARRGEGTLGMASYHYFSLNTVT